jgi:hypothetical protein
LEDTLFLNIPTYIQCSLCASKNIKRIDGEDHFYHCGTCDLRFLDPKKHLLFVEEKHRYEQHNNDVHDERYQAFVKPLFDEIQKRTTPPAHGLDYGAGPGPVLALMLQKYGLDIALYDPIFHNNNVFNDRYDFVFASESAEHFYQPSMEFERIRKILNPHGFLAIMTHIYKIEIDFPNWYYKKDPCHVVFYSEKTFAWMREHYRFSNLEVVSPRIAIFTI